MHYKTIEGSDILHVVALQVVEVDIGSILQFSNFDGVFCELLIDLDGELS